MRDKAVIAGLLDSYWAMEPQVLGRMAEVVLRHARGVKLDGAEVREIVAARGDGGQTPTEVVRRGATAIVPITGILVKHSYLVNGDSQPRGTSTLGAAERLNAALADPGVQEIVLLIDSPGGSVFGIADLASAIRQADAVKPVHAMIEDMGASAAYWLASQARTVSVNATGMVGSIGVYTVMVDSSRRADQEGLRFDLVKAGQYKGIGVAGTPVTESDRRVMQAEVDALYEHFVGDVAAGRGMDAGAIRQLADGRVHIGQAAVDLGLADGVSTLDALVERLEGARAQAKGNSAGRPGVPAARKTTIAAAGGRESEMNKDTTTSPPVEEPAVDAEAIKSAAAKEANDAAAARVRELAGVLAGRTELLTQAIADGLDVTGAKALLADVLAGEVKSLGEQLTAARAEAATVAQELASLKELVARSGIKPLAVGAKEPAAAGSEGDGGYEASVAAQVEKGTKEHRARINAAREFPEAHQAWLKGQRPRK